MDLRQTTSAIAGMVANIERVIVGKQDSVQLAVVALFGGQHLLLEGVPGVGKTVLARAIARSIDGSFKRIQGTSDLLPADITGASVFDQGSGRFTFVAGPVFTNVLLFDEINRTGPKTQSALMEVMDEGRVSVDGEVHELPRPFFVVATRNPIEHHGTFPLPEGELDRFGVSIEMGYADPGAERLVITGQLVTHPVDELEPVISTDDVIAHRAAIRNVHVDTSIVDYIVAIAGATRERADVALGASTRAAVSLTRTSQAFAIASGRDYVLPDDVKIVATSVLTHRVLLSPQAATTDPADVIDDILDTLPAPVASTNR